MSSQAADLAATRQAYDAVAQHYARLISDMTLETPLDRAILAAFCDMIDAPSDQLVAEVGCGSGRVTKHLHDAGLHMVGLDLSPNMVAIARAMYEDLPFIAAHAAALPLAAGVLGGVVSWYSLINLPTSELAEVFTEFARVTKLGAPLVVAFQCGDGQRVERTTSYEQPVSLVYYRHRIGDVLQALEAAGFALYASVRRSAALEFESTPQAILIAQRQQPR
jgi:ubiquinone/menaquinone biosynthesis C-methylase UbiE